MVFYIFPVLYSLSELAELGLGSVSVFFCLERPSPHNYLIILVLSAFFARHFHIAAYLASLLRVASL